MIDYTEQRLTPRVMAFSPDVTVTVITLGDPAYPADQHEMTNILIECHEASISDLLE